MLPYSLFSLAKADCRSPADINHGLKIGNNYTHGETVRYFCNLGYALEGEAQLTCEDGRWNTDIPKCKGKDHCCSNSFPLCLFQNLSLFYKLPQGPAFLESLSSDLSGKSECFMFRN